MGYNLLMIDYDTRLKDDGYRKWGNQLAQSKGLRDVEHLEEVYGDMPFDMFNEKMEEAEGLQELIDEDNYHGIRIVRA